MGGEGSMLAMIVSLKNNRALVKKRKKLFTQSNIRDLNHTHTDLRFKHVSDNKLERIKLKIRKNQEKENRRILSAFIGIIFLLVGICLFLCFKYFTV